MGDISKIYSSLTDEKKANFNKDLIEKLGTFLGGYGELTVLGEYIGVMLASSRPRDSIRNELGVFLQEHSSDFTEWLFSHLEKIGGGEEGSGKRQRRERRGNRAAAEDAATVVAPAEGAEAPASQGARLKKNKKTKEEKDAKRESKRASRSAPAAPAAAAPTPVPTPAATKPPQSTPSGVVLSARERRRAEGGVRLRRRDAVQAGAAVRSRSRHRRKQKEGAAAADPDVAGALENGGGAASRAVLTARDPYSKGAVLVPNAQAASAQDPYAKEPDADLARSLPPDARWHYRPELGEAERRAAPGFGPPGVHPSRPPYDAYGAATPEHPPGYHGAHAPAVSPGRPRQSGSSFALKKWRVARAGTVVKATESLESPQVQVLQEGEIVEQVSPAFPLPSGIIRLQIRHPSSPHFPNPIGWVTQDATAAGGPVFLEPGPEPLQGYRQFEGPRAAPPGQWRPRGPLGGAMPPAGGSGAPAARWTPTSGYSNLTWTPGRANGGEAKEAAAKA